MGKRGRPRGQARAKHHAPQYLSTSFWEMIWQRHMLGASVPALAKKMKLSPGRIRNEFYSRGWGFRLAGLRHGTWTTRAFRKLSLSTGLSTQKILFVWAVHMCDPEEIKDRWAALVEAGLAEDFGEVGVNESLASFHAEIAKIKEKYQATSWLEDLPDQDTDNLYNKDH